MTEANWAGLRSCRTQQNRGKEWNEPCAQQNNSQISSVYSGGGYFFPLVHPGVYYILWVNGAQSFAVAQNVQMSGTSICIELKAE